MDDIEKMAKAAFEKAMEVQSRAYPECANWKWEQENELCRQHWRSYITAALDAVMPRDPTDAEVIGGALSRMR